MMLQAPQVLSKDEVRGLRALIDAADWTDGNATSGPQAALAKRNMQLPEDSAAAREASGRVLDALGKSALFFSAALPLKVFPPLFNRYEGGQNFGAHIDNAIRMKRGGDLRVRTDLSATLFLSEPEEYEGGELTVEDTYGVHEVKLAAGDLIVYPASSLHYVTPVTEGARVSSFFWIQSMIREDAKRSLLFNMDVSIQQLAQRIGQGDAQVVALTGTYHNLLRMWAET